LRISNCKLTLSTWRSLGETPRDFLSNLQFAICNLQFAMVSSLLVLILLCWLLFFRGLGDRDLGSSHEARAAQDAQSILLDQQWGLPRLFDRKVELQKPPLFYWLVAAVAQCQGGSVDAWAVRLPAAGAGLGGVLVLYVLGLRRGRPLAGFLAAALLATAIHYTWLSRTGRIDMPLTLTVSLTLAGYYLAQRCRYEQEGRSAWGWLLLAYIAAALAVLLKGPIGLVLPAAVVGIHLLTEGEVAIRRPGQRWLGLAHELGLWWGIPLVLALTLPWFLWANARTNGHLFQVFFWEHNVERGLGGGRLRAHPWWFYGPQLAFDFLPWSPLLPLLAWRAVRRGWWRADPEARFGLVWLLTMFLVLSCAGFKRADYLVPAYPGAALFLGSVAERCYRAAGRRRLLAGGLGLPLVVVPVGWLLYLGYILPRQEPLQEYRPFAAEIRRLAPAPQLILFFRAEAHAVAFYVGEPIDTLLEWENLDVWAGRPHTYYVVMPSEYAREWPRHLKSGWLEKVCRSGVLAGARHDDPLVLLRTHPGAAPSVPD
jgi:4-amino-4-deoxy-L-arabinose transferase-like glycosyltransferase